MSKGNLLIVDDEPLLLKNLKANLEDYADQIFTASNGFDALNIISKEEVHCIICDINMPRMSGIEVIKRLREMGNNTPFIFFTGHSSPELMLEVVKYGAFDLFDKPHLDGLENVISRGMKNGFNNSEKGLMSEYRRILKEHNK